MKYLIKLLIWIISCNIKLSIARPNITKNIEDNLITKLDHEINNSLTVENTTTTDGKLNNITEKICTCREKIVNVANNNEIKERDFSPSVTEKADKVNATIENKEPILHTTEPSLPLKNYTINSSTEKISTVFNKLTENETKTAELVNTETSSKIEKEIKNDAYSSTGKNGSSPIITEINPVSADEKINNSTESNSTVIENPISKDNENNTPVNIDKDSSIRQESKIYMNSTKNENNSFPLISERSTVTADDKINSTVEKNFTFTEIPVADENIIGKSLDTEKGYVPEKDDKNNTNLTLKGNESTVLTDRSLVETATLIDRSLVKLQDELINLLKKNSTVTEKTIIKESNNETLGNWKKESVTENKYKDINSSSHENDKAPLKTERSASTSNNNCTEEDHIPVVTVKPVAEENKDEKSENKDSTTEQELKNDGNFSAEKFPGVPLLTDTTPTVSNEINSTGDKILTIIENPTAEDEIIQLESTENANSTTSKNVSVTSTTETSSAIKDEERENIVKKNTSAITEEKMKEDKNSIPLNTEKNVTKKQSDKNSDSSTDTNEFVILPKERLSSIADVISTTRELYYINKKSLDEENKTVVSVNTEKEKDYIAEKEAKIEISTRKNEYTPVITQIFAEKLLNEINATTAMNSMVTETSLAGNKITQSIDTEPRSGPEAEYSTTPVTNNSTITADVKTNTVQKTEDEKPNNEIEKRNLDSKGNKNKTEQKDNHVIMNNAENTTDSTKILSKQSNNITNEKTKSNDSVKGYGVIIKAGTDAIKSVGNAVEEVLDDTETMITTALQMGGRILDSLVKIGESDKSTSKRNKIKENVQNEPENNSNESSDKLEQETSRFLLTLNPWRNSDDIDSEEKSDSETALNFLGSFFG